MTCTKTINSITFGFLMLLTSSVQAGFYYQATTTNDTAGDVQTTQMTGWSEGNSTRIEFSEGDNVGIFGPGTYLLSTDAGETLTLVNPEEKTYSPFDIASMMNTADQVMESMGGMMSMEITDTYFNKISEKPGGKILGHATQEVNFDSGYTVSISVFGRKMDQVITSNQQMWVASSVDPAIFSAWLRPDKMMKGMFKGMGDLIDTQFGQMQGAPLKSIIKTTSSGGMGGQEASENTMTTEVTTLRKETIPAATFVIPQDYTETNMMTKITGDEGEESQNNKAMQEGMSALKGLFGTKK